MKKSSKSVDKSGKKSSAVKSSLYVVTASKYDGHLRDECFSTAYQEVVKSFAISKMPLKIVCSSDYSSVEARAFVNNLKRSGYVEIIPIGYQ